MAQPKPFDLNRLIALVNLTASDQDGEALNALRAANRQAKAAGLTLVEAIASQNQQTNAAFLQDAYNRGYGEGLNEGMAKMQDAFDRGQEVGRIIGIEEGRKGQAYRTNTRHASAQAPSTPPPPRPIQTFPEPSYECLPCKHKGSKDEWRNHQMRCSKCGKNDLRWVVTH